MPARRRHSVSVAGPAQGTRRVVQSYGLKVLRRNIKNAFERVGRREALVQYCDNKAAVLRSGVTMGCLNDVVGRLNVYSMRSLYLS
jgi:hypothetical protein